jgi:hypothetical protein
LQPHFVGPGFFGLEQWVATPRLVKVIEGGRHETSRGTGFDTQGWR